MPFPSISFVFAVNEPAHLPPCVHCDIYIYIYICAPLYHGPIDLLSLGEVLINEGCLLVDLINTMHEVRRQYIAIGRTEYIVSIVFWCHEGASPSQLSHPPPAGEGVPLETRSYYFDAIHLQNPVNRRWFRGSIRPSATYT